MEPEIEFRVLGPLTVRIAGATVAIGAAKQRTLLAALLLQAGSEVRIAELTTALWDAAPPANPRAALHTYVKRLRQVLAHPDLITTTEYGYRVDPAPEQLDLFRLRSLILDAERARISEDLGTERAHLVEALSLWRGHALADVPSELLKQTDAARLAEQRLVILERRIGLDLDLGEHSRLIGELTELTALHPLREQFWAQLMLAQVRDGRRAEALSAYSRLSAHLKSELGTTPSNALSALHEAVLRDDTALRSPERRKPSIAGLVPAQLPADIPNFVGRQAVIEVISSALTGPAPRLIALSGPPGVGKTALAVHVAHRLREHFPGGQLYVNLRGYSPEPALAAEQILARFLRALGVQPELVPVQVVAQAAMYRRLLAERQVLVLLDNAADPVQLEQLLPDAPECAVLVTSRTELPQIAQSLPVGMLDPEESVDLLAGVLGEDAVRAEPESVVALADTCAHLPLALRIAAANVLGYRISDYVAQLHAGDPLAGLAVDGDGTAAVSRAFDLSFTALDADSRYAFCALALAPGTDLSPQAAAAMLNWSIDKAQEVLAGLIAMSLIEQFSGGRLGYHDLIRRYARRKAGPGEHVALGRLHDYVLGAAHDAAELIMAEPLSEELDWPGTRGIEQFETVEQAVAWLDTERAFLLAMTQAAEGNGQPWIAWSLVRALRNYFYFYDHRAEWLIVAESALEVAEQHGHVLVVASMLDNVGTAHWSVGDYQRARQAYARARGLLATAKAEADEVLAGVNLHLGIVAFEAGDLRDAEAAIAQALACWHQSGSAKQVAQALVNLGTAVGRRGDIGRGRDLMLEAIELCRRTGSRFGEGLCATNLTHSSLLTGDYRAALEWSRLALEINAELGRTEADCYEHLAVIRSALGQVEEALEFADRARTLAQESGDRRAEIDAMSTAGRVHLRGGRAGEALALCTEAFQQATLIGYRIGEIEAMIGMSAAFGHLGRPAAAADYAERAFALANRHGIAMEQGRALAALARARLVGGMADEAAELVHRAIDAFNDTGHRPGEAEARLLAGRVHRQRGEPERARREWELALALFTAMGVPEAEDVRELLRTSI